MLEHVTFITLKPHDHERIDAREFGLLDDYSKLVCLVLSPNCLLAAPLAPAALGMPALSVRKLVSAEPLSALATRTASTFDGSDSESHGGAAVAEGVVDICFHLFSLVRLVFSLIHLFVHYCACVTLQLHQESDDSSSSDNESDEDGGPGDEDNDAVGLVEEAVAARAHSIQAILKCDFCGEYSDKAL